MSTMRLGVVIYSNDPETVWNAFRLANLALGQGNDVKVFLLSKGVECMEIDTETFKVTEQAEAFVNKGGKILACGTCLKLRKSRGSPICPMSTMRDLYEMIAESDKLLTF